MPQQTISLWIISIWSAVHHPKKPQMSGPCVYIAIAVGVGVVFSNKQVAPLDSCASSRLLKLDFKRQDRTKDGKQKNNIESESSNVLFPTCRQCFCCNRLKVKILNWQQYNCRNLLRPLPLLLRLHHDNFNLLEAAAAAKNNNTVELVWQSAAAPVVAQREQQESHTQLTLAGCLMLSFGRRLQTKDTLPRYHLNGPAAELNLSRASQLLFYRRTLPK